MFTLKRIMAVSMVILTASAAGAISYALSQRAALRAADKPATDLERGKQEWRDQEGRHAEEMVKARMEAAEQEDQLRIQEQEWNAVRTDLSVLRRRIENTLSRLARPKVPQQLQGDEKELSAKEQKLRADVRKARQKFFLAEEKMWQLAREQERQRDRFRSRPDIGEGKRSSEQGTPLQRRLQKAEHELGSLRHQQAGLQPQVQQPYTP